MSTDSVWTETEILIGFRFEQQATAVEQALALVQESAAAAAQRSAQTALEHARQDAAAQVAALEARLREVCVEPCAHEYA